ncbi:S24 family peptidase [Brevundimonas sp.]|uniref:helix-turn-helix domain-containing protein n=1 Tax=Brevundimonas sp. TaxID=1871086 RepID=UPI00289CF274|nr:S24 family peptidase [Brevundimonas sp.]
MTDETLVAPDDDAEAKALGDAVRALRMRAKMSQAEAAAAMGLGSGEAWRIYEIGKAPTIFKPGVQFRLANAVGATMAELLAERDKAAGRPIIAPNPVYGDPFRNGERTELPIRDRIQAGAWLLADDTVQDFPRTFPAAKDGRYPFAKQWISEVAGDSMNLLGIQDGDYVQCVDAIDISYYPRHGDVVEVERLRNGGRERELTLKQIEMTATGFVLAPRSTNPRFQQPLRLDDGVANDTEDYEVRIRALIVTTMRRF